MKKLLLLGLFLSSPAWAWEASKVKKTKITYKEKIKKPEGSVTVKLSTKDLNIKIDRDFYGTQWTPFGDAISESLVQAMDLSLVRVGGNLYDNFNWENNMMFVGNQFVKDKSYEEVTRIIRTYGSEPVLQVNLMGFHPEADGNGSYVLKKGATAAHAGDLVRHLNGSNGLKVKNFCLGNEFAQWATTHAYIWPHKRTNENGEEELVPLSAEQYIERYVEYALAMREAQEDISGDPNDIKLWGPEMSISYYDWNTGNIGEDCKWSWTIPGRVECNYGNGKYQNFLPYFLERLSEIEKDPARNPRGYKLLDYLSFHYYPNFRTDITDPMSIMKDEMGRQRIREILGSTQIFHDKDYINRWDISSYGSFAFRWKIQQEKYPERTAGKPIPPEWDFAPNIIPRMKKWQKNYPNSKLVLSEFAFDSDDRTFGYHPIIRPLYSADLTGILATQGVEHFTRFPLFGESRNPVPWALIYDNKRSNNYFMYQLFSRNFRGKLLPVTDSMGDLVNGYASFLRDKKDGKQYIHLFLINKDARERTLTLNFERPNGKQVRIVDYKLPPWNVSFLKIPARMRRGHKIVVKQFGAAEMDIMIDPYYASPKPVRP